MLRANSKPRDKKAAALTKDEERRQAIIDSAMLDIYSRYGHGGVSLSLNDIPALVLKMVHVMDAYAGIGGMAKRGIVVQSITRIVDESNVFASFGEGVEAAVLAMIPNMIDTVVEVVHGNLVVRPEVASCCSSVFGV